jgi:hypothetical protein
MSDQPVVQISTPIRQGDIPQVVVRVDNPGEVQQAVETLNDVAELIAPLMKSAVMAMNTPTGTAEAITHLQQAGLSPQVFEPPPCTAGHHAVPGLFQVHRLR